MGLTVSALAWVTAGVLAFGLVGWLPDAAWRIAIRAALGGGLGWLLAPQALWRFAIVAGLLAVLLELWRWWRAPIRPPDPYGRQRRDRRDDGDGEFIISLPSLPGSD